MNEPHPVPNKVAMQNPQRSILLALLVAALTFLSLSKGAVAQLGLGRSSQNPDDPQLAADIGFGSFAWPNRWLPVTITLTGGVKAFDGAVSISYAQDDRTGTQILRAVAATPGKTSTYSALINLPPSIGEVTLVLRAKNGREVRRLTFNSFPDPGKGEVFLPPVSGTLPIVVALGEASDPTLQSARALQDIETDRHAIGITRPNISFVRPSTLPPSWAALDSVLMVVTTGETSSTLDPRTLAGVREWVSSGGRLIILTNSPGDGWRNWLASSPEQLAPIEIAPARTGAPPDELAGALAVPPPLAEGTTPRAITPGTPPAAPAPPASPAAPASPPSIDRVFKAAASFVHRPISITPSGRDQGWHVRFPTSDDPTVGCVAEGPLGFGWVVVVGFDPQMVASSVLNEATGRVWYSLLETALGDWRARATSPAAQHLGYITDQFSTGGLVVSDYTAQTARNTVLDKISDVPTASHSVFPVLAGAMFVFALLLGPFDALLLKKLQARHRSWATAIGWIGLATLAAYFAPTMARSGATRVNRVSIVDAMQTTADPASPAPAWNTAVTGVFAGASILAPFEGRLAGSWWKPTSSQQEYAWGRRDQMTPRRSVTTVQSMPDLTALVTSADDPWGGLGTDNTGIGGNIPGPINFKLWTFRTFQDQGRCTTPLRAIVHCDNSGAEPAWSVELRGLPKDAVIDDAALRVPGESGTHWHSLTFAAEGQAHTATASGPATPKPTGSWAPPDEKSAAQNPYYGWGARPNVPLQPSLALMLPGPDRREWAIVQALSAGRAVLYLQLSNMPLDVTLQTEADERHTQIVRLVVPIAGAAPGPESEENPQ